MPGRGYWNKLQAGKRLTQTPLPERDLVTVNRIQMSGELPQALRARIGGEPGEESETIEVRAERLRKRLGRVTVPRDFTKMHPLIEALLAKDEQRKLKAAEEIRKYGFAFAKPKFDTPLDRRRLALLNALFLGFERVGGRPYLRERETLEHGIGMGDASLSFKLDAISQSRKASSGTATRLRERLRFSVSEFGLPPGTKARWQDEDGLPLERQMTDIVIGMAVAEAYAHRAWHEQEAIRQREYQEWVVREAEREQREVEKRERDRLTAIEKAKLDALLDAVARWENANRIRAYVAAKLSTGVGDPELNRWATWARSEADRIDPLRDTRS
jgi:hypothetical protein